MTIMELDLEIKEIDEEIKDEVREMMPVLEYLVSKGYNNLLEVEERNGKWLTRDDIMVLFDYYMNRTTEMLQNQQLREILEKVIVDLYYKRREKFRV